MFGQILLFFSQISGSLGMGIILLTIAIRLALYPLTLAIQVAGRHARAAAQAAGAAEEVQEQAGRVSAQDAGAVSGSTKSTPWAGACPSWSSFRSCGPVYVLRDLPNLVGEEETTFLIWNLSVSAAEAGMVSAYLILPLLSGLTTYFQMSLTSTSDPSQRMMMMMMPIFLTYISTQFPSGLVLYWVVTNVFSIAEQYADQPATGGCEERRRSGLMRVVEKVGRTVDEAIQEALKQLGATRVRTSKSRCWKKAAKACSGFWAREGPGSG